MVKNSLELHLKTLCDENPEFISLYATWNLNKKTCTEVLKNVVVNYPHFSMHDVTHAEAVVTKIEMLLGERVNKLSPTDTWLILHTAYAHDLGMVLKWEEIEKIWNSRDFLQFLQFCSTSNDSELKEAAIVIQNMLSNNHDKIRNVSPLKISRLVKLINAAYFRKNHSQISRKYIELLKDGFGIDLGHSGLIQARIIKILGKICELHTTDSDEVFKLDYQTDGFGADYAHPRFVAILLRLGDLLDADNGRFSPSAIISIGNLPKSSVPHRDKHEATEHLLVTPTDIEFRSNCSTREAYLETRNFISWLEMEIDFLKRNWDLIAPIDIGGYVPRFDKKEVLYMGVPDIEGVTGLKFEISQSKAFQIIEGSNIYSDRFVFIREVIQNAMDASKIQMWKDLLGGNYSAWIKNEVTSQIQPFEIVEEIYKNYVIQVNLSTLEDGKTLLEVIDRGTGISVNTFKRMCNVGASISGDVELNEFVDTMPRWLRPTAGFGVGLQSIFLMADEFEIETNTGTESFHAVIHSNRTGGYLQLQRQNTRKSRGTTIKVKFDMPDRYSYAMFGDTMSYMNSQYDPFGRNYVGEVRTIETIKNNCKDSLFPIFIEASLEEYQGLTISKDSVMKSISTWEKKGDDIRYNLSKDYSEMDIWDSKNSAYVKVRLIKSKYSTVNVFFKGVKVAKNIPSIGDVGIELDIDLYGLDTKDTLSLDRGALTNNYSFIMNCFHKFIFQYFTLLRITSNPKSICIKF